MLTHGNQRKKDQLGMPFGTAMHRLRKAVVFDLLQRHGENICYVCNSWIETCEELSIEHKIPWQDNNTDLFWNIDNIAFSHRKCNRPHRTTGQMRRKIGPEGTSWCKRCKAFKDIHLFSKKRARWNGLNDQCKSCDSELRKKYR
jgi:5-methylcytosine-specific restriction endonuclease McrA